MLHIAFLQFVSSPLQDMLCRHYVTLSAVHMHTVAVFTIHLALVLLAVICLSTL